MSSSDLITAHEPSGGPPLGLGQVWILRWSHNNPPQDPKVSFADKVVLVTGANTGLGFEAAVKYAALGTKKLILAVRSNPKGEEAKKQIIERTGCNDGSIVILTVDLSEFESVQKFVSDLEKETKHLDVALLNAGLGNPSFERSSAGWEMVYQVNVLSTSLMAILLLPLLRSTAAVRGRPVHLTFVNSRGHTMVQEKWLADADGSLLKASNDEKTWGPRKAYTLSKLSAIAAMLAVARATSNEPNVIVNAVCPDLCKTELDRKFGVLVHLFGTIFQAIFARTAEQGSRALVSATALGPESHGRFWLHDILYPLGDLAQNEILMKQTWEEILDIISKAQPDAQQILESN